MWRSRGFVVGAEVKSDTGRALTAHSMVTAAGRSPRRRGRVWPGCHQQCLRQRGGWDVVPDAVCQVRIVSAGSRVPRACPRMRFGQARPAASQAANSPPAVQLTEPAISYVRRRRRHRAEQSPAVGPCVGRAQAATGYVQVHSAPFTAASGFQSAGSVACPGKKVPLGGGVTIASDSVVANINSSYPSGHSWVADVDNGTASSPGFTVYAVCAD